MSKTAGVRADHRASFPAPESELAVFSVVFGLYTLTGKDVQGCSLRPEFLATALLDVHSYIITILLRSGIVCLVETTPGPQQSWRENVPRKRVNCPNNMAILYRHEWQMVFMWSQFI
jgi:hypothetical protein|uniref:Uncharacterized protein n=1 Tax=Mus musculus TaxID=10090 RepID=Q3UX95_MOUSE|nr:unnamed protein product [Mus musculus]